MYYNQTIYNQIKLVSNWSEESGTRNRRYKQETHLARILIVIVITLICCHALRIFIEFYEMIVAAGNVDEYECMSVFNIPAFPMWFFALYIFSELMLAINSSANVVIYSCLSKSPCRCALRNEECREVTLIATSYCIEMEEQLTRQTGPI